MLKPWANISILPGSGWFDRLLVDSVLGLVGNHDHDDVGLFAALATDSTRRPSAFGLVAALASFVQADDDVETRIAQILRVGMTLAAVADDGDRLARKRRRDWRPCRSRSLRALESPSFLLPVSGGATPNNPVQGAPNRSPCFSISRRQPNSPAIVADQYPCWLIMPLPFVMAIAPVRTSSRMPNGFRIIASSDSIFSSGPVASISSVDGAGIDVPAH